MAEKRFDTRILLKYDSLSNWNSSSLVLKAGEVAIATVPATDAVAKNADGVITPPAAVVIKVGDGEHSFKDLPLVSGLAADVYGWAKKDENEFKEWLKGDFATKASVEAVDARVTAIDTAYKAADETLRGLIDAITGGSGDVEGLGTLTAKISDLETVLASFLGKDEEGHVVTDAVKLAIDAVANSVSELSGRVGAVEAEQVTIAGDIAALKEAVNGAEGVPSLSDKIASVQGEVDAVEEKLGEVAEGKTIVGLIDEAKESANDYTDEKVAEINGSIGDLDERVGNAELAIVTLNGEGDGSVKKQVADAIAAVVAGAPEDFDTLKEVSDWISNDKEGAAALQNTVAQHTRDIAGHTESLASLVAKDGEIDEAIAGLEEKISAIIGEGEGETGSLVELEGRIKANEDAILGINGKIGAVAENKTLVGLIGENTAAIAANAGAIEANGNLISGLREDVDGLTGVIGTVEEGSTIVGLIEAEAARADAAEKANAKAISEVDSKVNALHAVASSGLINDLGQKDNEELIFDCGNAAGATVIE